MRFEQAFDASASFEERFCCEKFPGACTVVIFGATGDLAVKKLFPALRRLFVSGLLHRSSRIVASSRRAIGTDDLAPEIRNDSKFMKLVHFLSFDPELPQSAENFALSLDRLDAEAAPLPRIYYLALPAAAYAQMIPAMARAGLFSEPDEKLFYNLVLEKPLGYSVAEMKTLRKLLKTCCSEQRIYLIDHYLGKDEVQNILMLRFANTIFSGVWNRKFIESITIGVSEFSGIGSRARYFDRAGIIRDMFQSHLLLALGLCIMRRPEEFDNFSITRSLLNAMKYVSAGKVRFYGQYEGYLQEKGIAPDSRTATCADIEFSSARCDWKGVKFRLFSGKRLARDFSFIRVTFRKVPAGFFGRDTDRILPGNELTLELKPESGISLGICAKKSGPHLCVGQLTLSQNSNTPADGYSRLLLDCLNCDRTFFPGFDLFVRTGKICDDLLSSLEHGKEQIYCIYPAGTDLSGKAAPE